MLSKELNVEVLRLTGDTCGRHVASPDPTPTPDARKQWTPQIQELSLMPLHVLEE